MALLRRGLCGEPVRILQEQLGVSADGVFGKGTEDALRSYQSSNGLSADGIAGPDTFHAMGLDHLIMLERPIRGQLVRKLQLGLDQDADGIFGQGTEAAVRNVQEANGLEANGKAGPETLRYVAGFEEMFPQEKVDASLITEETPVIDPATVEQVRTSEEEPPKDEGFIAHTVHSVEDTVSNVGKSIWSTVRSIF